MEKIYTEESSTYERYYYNLDSGYVEIVCYDMSEKSKKTDGDSLLDHFKVKTIKSARKYKYSELQLTDQAVNSFIRYIKGNFEY